ncbi:MAG: sporulation protein YtfJ [Clostridia bacterium]|nr:sporulation protein YtfJ [Clostridia bacterium]
MEESKQTEIIKIALENAKRLFDADTIVGKPIEVKNGTQIIPISKVSVGVASGGLDYFGKATHTEKNFGGGGGTGVNIIPLGFLVINDLGHVELLSLEQKSRDFTSYLFEFISSSPDFIEKFKGLFNSSNNN